MTQLDLFATEVTHPDPTRTLTCASCGKTQKMPVFGWNHTLGDGWCISKVLRRNHVISFARLLAADGVWNLAEGRISKTRDWTHEQGRADLDTAVSLARDVGISDDEIAALVAAEGVAL